MRDEDRPKFKPEEPEPDPSADGSVLPEDHPFAVLVGHNPGLMKAMATALDVLKEQAQDDQLKEKIGQAAEGRVSFADLVQDPTFGASFSQNADVTEAAIEEARENLDDEAREELKDEAQKLADRITNNGQLVDDVKKAFGPLAPE